MMKVAEYFREEIWNGTCWTTNGLHQVSRRA